MRKKLVCCFIITGLIPSAHSADCTVDSILNILSNKTVNETQSKLCSYYFTTLYTQKDLTTDLCKNLVDPCTDGLEENSRNYEFHLNEFRLATQIKAIDDQYNDEIADIEFNNAVKLNFSAEEQKQIGVCPEVSSTRMEQCPLFEGIPQSVITDAQHFLYSNNANKNGIDYIYLITERGDAVRKLEDVSQDQREEKLILSRQLEEIDKKIEAVTSKIQKSGFENGTKPLLYSKQDDMLENLIALIKENDYKNEFLSAYKFHPGSGVHLTGGPLYEKDIIVDSWWKRLNLRENDDKKNALDKLIKETRFTSKNFEKEAAQLIKKVRLHMARDIAKEICNEKSLKVHREINKQGGLCKVIEKRTKPLENASLEDYWKMYPFEQERLKAAHPDDLQKNFNSHMALWSCSQIAPSKSNNASAHKVSEKEWKKIGESFNNQTKQNEIHTNKLMTERFGKSAGIRNLGEIIEEQGHKKENFAHTVEPKTNNTPVAGKEITSVPGNVSGNFKNNFLPIENSLPNNTFIPDVPPAQKSMAAPEQIKQEQLPVEEERSEPAVKKKKKSPTSTDDNSERISAMRKELEQLKSANGDQTPSSETNAKDPVVGNNSQHEENRSSALQVPNTVSGNGNKNNVEEARTVSPNSSFNSAASAENEKISSMAAGNKTKSAEASPLVLLNKSYDETSDLNQLITNPKESDLITIAEKTEGRPFLIREKEDLFQIVPSLDSKGKILMLNGKMVFKKIKMNQNQKKELSKKLEILREAKELSKIPIRKQELDSLLKQTSR